MQRGNLLEGMELFVGYKGGGVRTWAAQMCVLGVVKGECDFLILVTDKILNTNYSPTPKNDI